MPHHSTVNIDYVSGVSLPAFCLEKNDKFKDKLYAVDQDGATRTFGQVKQSINQASVALAQAGVKQGDTVFILAPNHINWPAAYFGIMQLGAVASLCNPAYSKTEIAHQLHDSLAKFAFVHPDQVAVLKDAVALSPGVTCMVSIGDAPGSDHPEIASFDDFTKNDGQGVPEVTIQGDDLAALPYSSGTTGLSKGVMLTHNNIVINLQQSVHNEFINYTESDVVLAVLPFYHIYGQVVMMNSCLREGVTMVIMNKFDPVKFLTLVQQHKITVLPIVPPIVLFLAKHPLVDKFDLSSVRLIFSGAAPLSTETANECVARFKNVAIKHGYGMTELSPVSHASPNGSTDNGFVLVANTSGMVVDIETGEEAKHGERGELWVKGPQVMKGYLNNPTATADTVDKDGWLHTGDIALVGEDNKFYVVDRLKELIKVKGFQVPPAELEALLLTHPALEDCAVIPIPDERCGEIPRAYVVKKKDAVVTEDDVKDFVKGKVAEYKQLRGGVEFVDAVPKSASGKILRRVLRDQFAEANKKATTILIPGTMYVKNGCPFCMKTLIARTEAGLEEKVSLGEDSEEVRAAIKAMLPEGKNPSFPTFVNADGSLCTESDELIEQFAKDAGKTRADFKLLAIYIDGCFKAQLKYWKMCNAVKGAADF